MSGDAPKDDRWPVVVASIDEASAALQRARGTAEAERSVSTFNELERAAEKLQQAMSMFYATPEEPTP